MSKIVPAHNIGSYVPMIDGPEKVSGRAKYTADIAAPGQLAGRILHDDCGDPARKVRRPERRSSGRRLRR